MQNEDIFLGLNDVGKIFFSLNSLEKSGFGKKEHLLTLFFFTTLRRYAVTGFTNNHSPEVSMNRG